jgi:hypothetical protein
MWFGTAVAACISPTGVVPMGLTGRSWACANAATRRKWVPPPPGPRLDDVEGAGGQERPELLEPGEVLPACHGGAHASADGRQPLGVPATDRLLHPDQVHGTLQLGHVSHRLLAGPDLVGVDHQPGPGPGMGLREDVADQQEPAEITLDIQTALQLGRPQAAGCVRLVHRDQLVVGQRDVQPEAYAATVRSRPPSSRHSGWPASFALLFLACLEMIHGSGNISRMTSDVQWLSRLSLVRASRRLPD